MKLTGITDKLLKAMKYFNLQFFFTFILILNIVLLSVYIYELHCALNVLKSNYNELMTAHASFIKDLSQVPPQLPTQGAEISSFDLFLTYLPFIICACTIIYIGVDKGPALVQYIQSCNLPSVNIGASYLDNYIAPSIQSELNTLDACGTAINKFFLNSLIQALVAAGALAPVPRQRFYFDESPYVPSEALIAFQARVPVKLSAEEILNTSITVENFNTPEIQDFIFNLFYG